MTLSLSRLPRVLIVSSLAIVLLGWSQFWFTQTYGDGTYFETLSYFNLATEISVPSVYSSAFLMLCAIILVLVSCASDAALGRSTRHWPILAGIFAYLSLDEFAGIHEELTPLMHHFVHLPAFLSYAWVVPVFAVLCVLAIYYLPFLLRLPRKTMILMIISGVIYVGGAMGMEFFEAMLAADNETMSFLGQIERVVEESLEIVGMTMFACTLLAYLKSLVSAIDYELTA